MYIVWVGFGIIICRGIFLNIYVFKFSFLSNIKYICIYVGEKKNKMRIRVIYVKLILIIV